jgi:hypothetical protein
LYFEIKRYIQISPNWYNLHATQPRCYGDKLPFWLNNVRPQYKLICICKAVELSEYLGLITAEKNHTFVNVSQGRYNITTTTDDGCTMKQEQLK